MDPRRKRMFQIKTALVIFSALQGVATGMFSRYEPSLPFPEEILAGAWGSIAALLIFALLGCMVFAAILLFGITFPRVHYGKVNENILRYFDFTWALMFVVAGHLGIGIVRLIREIAADSPYFRGNLAFYVILVTAALVINYFLCRKCDEWQKRNYFGPLVNSGIDSLLHKITGKKTEAGSTFH